MPGSPSGPSAPSVNLPKGGGAIRGVGEKFGSDLVTGAGSMTVPIATSPGRSGFGPQLALTYDSGSGNGPFGFGWSLSLPAITRKTDKGLPRYLDSAESDVFVLSGAEDLVPAFRTDATGQLELDDGRPVVDDVSRDVDGVTYRVRRYLPRVEGTFARIERWTNDDDRRIHWRTLTRDNVLTIYGRTEQSQIVDATDSSRVFSWLACESRDDRGNGVVYEFKAEDGTGVDLMAAHQRNRGDRDDPRRRTNRYLKRIRYGNRVTLLDGSGRRPPMLAAEAVATGDWMFDVVFDYGEHDAAAPTPVESGEWAARPDAFSSYRSGFEVRTARRCRRVLMFHHFEHEPGVGRDCLVRSTDFEYSDEQDPSSPDRSIYSFLCSVTQAGYRRTGDGYDRRSLPPVSFEYSPAVVHDEVADVDPVSLENLPAGLDGTDIQWIDLHGEGLPGILTEEAGAWFYKRTLSPASARAVEFAPREVVAERPQVVLVGGRAQITDLAGDGLPDVVVFDDAAPGSYPHDEGEGWDAFRSFPQVLNRAMRDPNLRLVDLDGDGHADLLVTEGDALVWHQSLGMDGFGPAQRTAVGSDDERGPAVVFTNAGESVVLADLSGDGLSDLVRIRNGDICYWPNLGYGRFGAKVTMDDAPWFDSPEHFDATRLRIADVDGSGTTDLLYLHGDGARLYFNQSGNGWSSPHPLHSFPPVDDTVSVAVLDLLGNGTACLVWSSRAPGETMRPMRYLKLMGDGKPHLLVAARNNLGAETRVRYAPSTTFSLRDKLAGRPWLTRLPFPVHVVERVETYDHVSRNRFVTRYAYHHGFYDGEEREFRGFAMVEQWDTEEFSTFGEAAMAADNVDAASNVPPVHTKTWFHTGLHLGRDHVSDHFAGLLGPADQGEYFREPGLHDDDARAHLLDDTVLPAGLTPAEEREACRALKGLLLRREVYADDAAATATAAQVQRALTPYTITEQNFTIRTVQPRRDNRHAVFFTHARESISHHLERDPADPRVEHALTLEVDRYGNVLKQASVAYGRRSTTLTDVWDQHRQMTSLVTFAENRVTNPVELPDVHRVPLPCESRTFELTGYSATGPAARHVPADFVEPDPANPGRLRHRFANEVAYEAGPTGGGCRRLIEWTRTLYRSDDMAALSPLGQMEPLALPGEGYRLAFTPGLLAQVFVRAHTGGAAELLLDDPAAVLSGQGGDRGGFVGSAALKADGRFPAGDPDGLWWSPSGRAFHGTPSDDVATELAQARAHFFLTRRVRDPFGHDTLVEYDGHDLLVVDTRDASGNRTTVDVNDYRVLQPRLVSDPNRNRTEVVFDALGMVVGTASMGKASPAPAEGDSLTDFVADLVPSEIDAFFAADDPLDQAPTLLRDATTRVVYDLDRFRRTQQANLDDPAKWEPSCAATLTRETGASTPLPLHGLRIQLTVSCSDGFGRVVQRKVHAEPGQVVDDGPVIDHRWVASGWTVFNNKGKPVRQYEPFFTATHRFEPGVQAGVSRVLFYDPVERVVATLHPNHTYEKIVVGPWQQTTFDVNDTCAPREAAPADGRPAETGDPRSDPDIAGFVAGYFAALPDTWQTWREQRLTGSLGPDERNAAVRAEGHAGTPSTVHLDVMGRPFLTIAQNRVVCPGHDLDGTEARCATRIEIDIEGNHRSLRDERNLPVDHLPTGEPEQRFVSQYTYDLLGNRIRQGNIDAGARWMLADTTGRPIRSWDDRGHSVVCTYDALRRLVGRTVRGTTPESDPRTFDRDVLVEMIEYGEPAAGASQAELDRAMRLNLRTRVHRHFDAAGVVTNARLAGDGVPVEAYDFQGNLLHRTRRFARDYTSLADWSQQPEMETETFESSTRYDALNRPIQTVTPHSNLPRATRDVIQPVYNAANLLERVDVWLERDTEPTSVLDRAVEPPAPVGVAGIDYDAKGRRRRIDHKNGASTSYQYDPATFELAQMVTRRGAPTFPGDDPVPPVAGWPGRHVQDLRYTRDPVGNITHVQDDAQQAIFLRNRRVEPSNDYTYDACYRLVQASGREHLGQGNAPAPHSHDDAGRVGLLSADLAGRFSPSDGAAMASYVERYVHDGAGNLLQIRHLGTEQAIQGWTRRFDHGEVSALEAGPRSNRLSRTQVGNGVAAAPEVYQYDAHGNVVRMPHLGGASPAPNMFWDHEDQLRQIDLGGGGTVHYVYDASGERVRKVWEKSPGLVEERLYLGGAELFRRHNGPIAADSATLERATLHVFDEQQRIAMVETRTLDLSGDDAAPRRLIRYQFGNHLASACLELDEQAQIISYEEYSPYGSSTYQGVRSLTETPKRYRFSGRERDEESGANYHGARYYAPWLGRWLSTDPLWRRGPDPRGPSEGSPQDRANGPGASEVNATGPFDLNLYEYVNGRVTFAVDRTGLSPTRVESTTIARWREAFERKPTVNGRPYDRGGTTRGSDGDAMLKKYGETEGLATSTKPVGKTTWMLEKSDKHPTAESTRYIYTKKGGWIDMVHFLFYAGRARVNLERYRNELDSFENRAKIYILNKISSEQIDFQKWKEDYARTLALQATAQEGRMQEWQDDRSTGEQKLSAYSYEDLPTDKFGADFAINFYDPNSSKTLAEQVEAYLQRLNATEPEKAPNWADVPDKYVSPTAPRNETDKPMFTTEP